ncbi:MAG: hypothetical protein EOP49_05275 [Sphingobacteriales bacterium]|nr:MAG: hypothetical protein EOP49_05275 [Sphingobacteriales bacterium]
MKTNLYGFIIALLLNATIAIAYPGNAPFTATDSTTSSINARASVAGFQCTATDKRTQLTWSVNNNEMTGQLELERSVNGKDFKTAAIIFPTEETGTAEYVYRDNIIKSNITYRIKIIQKNGKVEYSTAISR